MCVWSDISPQLDFISTLMFIYIYISNKESFNGCISIIHLFKIINLFKQ